MGCGCGMKPDYSNPDANLRVQFIYRLVSHDEDIDLANYQIKKILMSGICGIGISEINDFDALELLTRKAKLPLHKLVAYEPWETIEEEVSEFATYKMSITQKGWE